MRTVTFDRVMLDVARKLGWHPDGSELSTDQQGEICAAINDRVEEAVQFAWWPEWMNIEERQFRPSWDDETTYGIGDEVYSDDEDAYYISLTAGNLDNDPADDDGTNWEEQDELNPYVDYEQDGETPIGDVRDVFKNDPRVNNFGDSLGFSLSGDGVQVVPDSATKVWLWFRRRPPVYTIEDWDQTKSYETGDTVYDSDSGNCYIALQASEDDAVTDTDYWELIPFPAIFRAFITTAAYADLIADDNEETKATTALSRAYLRLSNAADMIAGQDQAPTAKYRNK